MISWPQPSPENSVIPVARPDISQLELDFISHAVQSGEISGGGEPVRLVESELSAELGIPTISVANGSVALMLALRALEIGHGDEVLVPSLTYAATASSVVNVGASPVFCDSDWDDWNISLASAMKMLTANTKAIILVDVYGLTRDWSALYQWARSEGLSIIHDCAESFGAKWNNEPSGAKADFSTNSYFANKLVTCGEGGSISSSNPELLERARLLRGQGMSPQFRYWFEEAGYNFRLSSLQAAFLRAQLTRIEQFTAKRWDLFDAYDALLGSVSQRPKSRKQSREDHSPWMYSVTLTHHKASQVATRLAERGVESRTVFYPLALQPAFSRFRSDETPVAYQISKTGISLPTFSNMTESEQVRLFQSLDEVINGAN